MSCFSLHLPPLAWRLAAIQAVAILLAVAPVSRAGLIGGNFCSVAPIVDYPAGLVPQANFNDYTEPAGYSAAGSAQGGVDLFYDNLAAVPASVVLAWDVPNGGAQNTNDTIIRPIPPATLGQDIQDGHDQMMAGYLQGSRKSPYTPSITFSGLNLNDAFSVYDLILYIDGDSDVQPTQATALNQYFVNLWSDSTKTTLLQSTLYGRDAADFVPTHTVAGSLLDYVPVTSNISGSPTVGNYVRFNGITSDSFFVEIVGVAGGTDGSVNNGGHGVALNAFQIVPEPSSALLGLLGTLGMVAGAAFNYRRK